jgi:osmoprotectant transport system ATP-binding protein
VIELAGVSKGYGGKSILRRTSLDVAPRTRLALVGPSGCGKSTLLRLVLGLLVPDEGTVTVGGRLVTPETCREVRLKTGYVIQDGGLFPHMTGEENVALMASHLGWEKARIDARLVELAELAGLERDLLGRYPSQLSGGQRQRVGIMRALMLDPDVLLMDEPLGALDPILRVRLQNELLALFVRLDKTVLFVTHDMREAAVLGQQIAVMKDGRIVQRGTFGALREAPADAYVAELLAAGSAAWAAGDVA